MHIFGSSPPQRSRRFIFAAICLFFCALGLSCRISSDVANSLQTPPPISTNALALYITNIDARKNLIAPVSVHIDGEDIQLPLTPSNNEPANRRVYSFYVWAYYDENPNESLMEMMTNGTFNLEVIGVKARFVPPNYSYKGLDSKRVVEMQINSADIDRSFTILAWFPTLYKNFENSFSVQGAKTNDDPTAASKRRGDKNPYGARRDVRVYNGDLRTSIQIIGPNEVAASFGRHFHKYFYVGRVFFRNRHPDKDLVVYTTSIQANTLLYRKTDPKRVQPYSTNLLNAVPKMSGRAYVDPDLLSKCLNAALQSGVPELGQRGEIASNIAEKLWRTNRNTEQVKEAQYRMHRLWRMADVELFQLDKRENANLDELRSNLRKMNLMAPRSITNIPVAEESNDGSTFSKKLEQLQKDLNRTPVTQGGGARAATMVDLLQEAARINRDMDETRYLRSHLVDGRTPESDWSGTLRALRTKLIAQATSPDLPASPMDEAIAIGVNPNNRPMAFSEDSILQIRGAEQGMVWKDKYRPMTFQAVLNSLIMVHEQSWESRVVKYLESAARVAGGMAALGTVVNELSSRGYTEGVNIFSTILMPEISKLLLDDLNKHVRNLGEMSMDTVMLIPPNQVMDRYVFFPKGPIYNFVDEFNISDPAYIVNIDSSDVSAEAILTDKNTPIVAGELAASSLVQRALNEGKASADLEALKLSEMQEKNKRFELVTTGNAVEELLEKTLKNGEVEKDATAERRDEINQIKRTARQKIADFEKKFGPDTTGYLAKILQKYGVSYLNAPPAFGAIESLKLPGGFKSRPISIHMLEEANPWTLRFRVFTNTNPSAITTDNVKAEFSRASDPEPSVRVTVRANTVTGKGTNAVIGIELINSLDLSDKKEMHVNVVPFDPVVKSKGSYTNSISMSSTNGLLLPTNKIVIIRFEAPLFDAAQDLHTISASVLPPLKIVGDTAKPPLFRGTDEGPIMSCDWMVDTSGLTATNQLTLRIPTANDSSQDVVWPIAITSLPTQDRR